MIVTSRTIDESPQSFIVASIIQRSFIDELFGVVVEALENLTFENPAREMSDVIALETFLSDYSLAI